MIITGRPSPGSKRGQKIGFPTINLKVEADISKKDFGVYFSYVFFDKKKLPAVSHLGPILTFGDKEIKCEIHIISWRQEIEADFVKVKLFKKIREIKKFDSVDKLTKQIASDIARARKYFRI